MLKFFKDSKSCEVTFMWVRPPPPAPKFINNNSDVQPDMSLNAEFDNLDNQKLDITKITELPDGQYKVYGRCR